MAEQPANMISCPKCGAEGPIQVEGFASVTLELDSSLQLVDHELGDTDWERDVGTICTACGYEGIYSEFETDER